jgi:hypothetical protein
MAHRPQDAWQPPSYLEAPAKTPDRTVIGVLAALIVVLLIVGAVGAVVVSRHSKPNPVALITAAPNTTANKGTAHFNATVSLTGPADITFSLSGETNFSAKTTQLQVSAAGITETVRVVGGIEYLNLPLLSLPHGTHWVKILPQDLGVTAGPSTTASWNPTDGLQFLGGNVGNPVDVGKQDIDGVSTTHYRVTLNLKALFDRVGSAERNLSPAIARGLEALQGLDLTHIPGDVWLDSAGRVRRFSYTLNFQIDGVAVAEVETINFSDFGAPVQITAPAAGDTVPFSAVKGQISAALSGSPVA